jgi:hypothetical protein
VVQHHEVTLGLETGPAQVIGAGQTGLTSAYDDDLSVVHPSTNRVGALDLP